MMSHCNMAGQFLQQILHFSMCNRLLQTLTVQLWGHWQTDTHTQTNRWDWFYTLDCWLGRGWQTTHEYLLLSSLLQSIRNSSGLYAKRSLMSWVVVIPKEGWTGNPSILLLVWHRLFKKKILIFFLKFIYSIHFFFFLKSRCHTKRRMLPVHPSFGMTMTQDIRDLFV